MTPASGVTRGCIASEREIAPAGATLDDYLKLLDGTGRQFRKDKKGQIPDTSAPILERMECRPETWLDFAQNFRLRLRFRNEAGLATPRHAKPAATEHGQVSPLSKPPQSRRHPSSDPAKRSDFEHNGGCPAVERSARNSNRIRYAWPPCSATAGSIQKIPQPCPSGS